MPGRAWGPLTGFLLGVFRHRFTRWPLVWVFTTAQRGSGPTHWLSAPSPRRDSGGHGSKAGVCRLCPAGATCVALISAGGPLRLGLCRGPWLISGLALLLWTDDPLTLARIGQRIPRGRWVALPGSPPRILFFCVILFSLYDTAAAVGWARRGRQPPWPAFSPRGRVPSSTGRWDPCVVDARGGVWSSDPPCRFSPRMEAGHWPPACARCPTPSRAPR